MATAVTRDLMRLDQVDPAGFPDRAGRIVHARLLERGEPPYSLCEAFISPREVQWLCEWARVVTPGRLDDAPGHGGLIFLALLAEYNRRHSDGDTVWRGVSELFEQPDTRAKLFFSNGYVRPATQEWIRETARRYNLRHVFDGNNTNIPKYYLTIQLQYGFSQYQVEQNLSGWLAGATPTEAMQRLLEPEGIFRSRSFRKLMTDLKHLRRDYITEVDVRRTLATCPWVLPEWHDLMIRIVGAIGDAGPTDEGSCPEEPSADPLDRPRIEWDSERGPVARSRLRGIARPKASRYHLWCGRRLLASWFRQVDGRYVADRGEVELPADRPVAAVSLKDGTGATVAVQVLTFWDDAEDVVVLQAGRAIEPGRLPEPGRPFALGLREGFCASDDRLEWRLSGPADDRRRWVFVAEPGPDLRVVDGLGHVAWQAGEAVRRPEWADRVRIDWEPRLPQFEFGETYQVTIAPPPETSVEHATLNGRPLRFADGARRRSRPILVEPEQAVSGVQVRVGLSRQGVAAVARVPLKLPIRGLAAFLQHDEGAPGWEPCSPNGPIAVEDALGRPFRAFTDGPDALMEGEVFHRRIDRKRARPLGRLLGTGGLLKLATGPFSPQDEFAVAGFAIDRGIVEAVDVGGGPPSLRLRLTRPLAPTGDRRVVLWSDRHGLAQVEADRLEVRDDGREWVAPTPWGYETGPLIAAVAEQGYRLGFRCRDGDDLLAFVAAGPSSSSDLSARQRLALIRWFRLPALMPDPKVRQRQAVRPLAESRPSDLVAVAVLDQGLDGLPGGDWLRFSGAADSRMAFDVIARELLLDFRPSHDQARAIEAEFIGDGVGVTSLEPLAPLFLALPMLGARVLQVGWPGGTTQRERSAAREQLLRMQLAVAGVDRNASIPRLKASRERILERARTTLSEGGRAPDEYLIQGLAWAAWHSVFEGRPLEHHERRDLNVAHGSAAFRQHLALHLLDGLLSRC